ncbi:uncharacterized protein IL334_000612 [Kwoniella shivajii]|uniref:SGT1-domain-containing protein n=1 Tax=Kwoniella shivajii TaxID=564305 RepID=A0ABZ1CQN0_9TREE|nr:hypothetical protein IL334_000612 [Kwoniella shivajii]
MSASTSFPSLSQTGRAFPLPSISEDTLHYTLHLSSRYEPTSTALLLNQYVESLLTLPWLWNKDSWELKVIPSVGSEGKLEGTMRVGDAVDDEWLVVWLLKKISEKWNDIIIGIRDTDGEFLLIEAANDLPSWVSPENAENRLWLQGGHLHLIPLSVRSTSSRPKQISDDKDMEKQFDPDAYISEEGALRAVRTGKYKADDKMERSVWSRISCYPDGLKTHQHQTKAYLPVPIARALKKNPELIQKAVEGFYVRDPSQLRTAARMTHFPPSPSILTPVILTRAAYAQLQGQVIHPPRVFGPEWHVADKPNSEGERRWRDLGVKIATGFEIMYREGGKKGKSGNEDDDITKQDEGYKSFLINLQKSGWFGDELEGSEKWKEKEEIATRGYRNIKSADTPSQRPSFAYLVDSAISSFSNTTQEELTVDPLYPEDSESWLEVSPDELDGMMMRASGRAAPSASADEDGKLEVGEEHGQALQDLAKKVEDFVGGQGDLTGARFEDELSDEDMNESEDDDDEVDQRSALESERATRLNNLVPSLPAEEWGKRTQAPSDRKEDVKPNAELKEKKEVKFSHQDVLSDKVRPPVFAKQEYDGVISDSESESESESELPPVGTLGRKIAQMKWSEGDVTSGATIEEIDEQKDDEERKQALKLDDNIDLDEEMQRRVWGDDDADEDDGEDDEDMDIDMAGEQEDFLKFAKDALGINEDLWKGILGDRKARGAFVPSHSASSKTKVDDMSGSNSKAKTTADPDKKVQFASNTTSTPASTKKNSEGDTSLNSFESIMKAMDTELSRNKPASSSKKSSKSSTKPIIDKAIPIPSSSNPLPPLPTEADLEAMDEDDLLAMDRELRQALKGAGIDDEDDEDGLDVEEARELDEDGKREYEMMKHFLESYRSQGGESGVVGNLFGRLGEK